MGKLEYINHKRLSHFGCSQFVLWVYNGNASYSHTLFILKGHAYAVRADTWEFSAAAYCSVHFNLTWHTYVAVAVLRAIQWFRSAKTWKMRHDSAHSVDGLDVTKEPFVISKKLLPNDGLDRHRQHTFLLVFMWNMETPKMCSINSIIPWKKCPTIIIINISIVLLLIAFSVAFRVFFSRHFSNTPQFFFVLIYRSNRNDKYWIRFVPRAIESESLNQSIPLFKFKYLFAASSLSVIGSGVILWWKTYTFCSARKCIKFQRQCVRQSARHQVKNSSEFRNLPSPIWMVCLLCINVCVCTLKLRS